MFQLENGERKIFPFGLVKIADIFNNDTECYTCVSKRVETT